ncbi:MAG: hypothetical protein M0027_14560 [Candidatus Dormibacteraeota bacterium]|nr:hypothetical protein [Candidatus Dormibacteraeota bacterium]
MKVYTLEIGCYSDRGLVGVYATAEAAMAAFVKGRTTFLRIDKEDTAPISKMRWRRQEYDNPIPGGPLCDWTNNGDWESAATVQEWEIELSVGEGEEG